jgi:hypothetical protein
MTEVPVVQSDAARALLRHTVATLAYRAEKVLREVPEGFADFRLSPEGRTAVEILGHMADLMEWGTRFAAGEYLWKPGAPGSWDASRERFFRGLAALDAALADPAPNAYPLEVIFQGPIADALTHVGQLAMMRGAAGLAVRPESYARAEIRAGRVGSEQSAKRTEFDGDASRPRRKTARPEVKREK